MRRPGFKEACTRAEKKKTNVAQLDLANLLSSCENEMYLPVELSQGPENSHYIIGPNTTLYFEGLEKEGEEITRKASLVFSVVLF